MRPFDYSSAENTEGALELISADTRPYAGGTDLLPRMKADIDAPERLVDIKNSDLPKGIGEADGNLSLGALTTLTEIEKSTLLKETFTLLPEAASLAATPQLRNRATLGGNLLQRPRCWYYRNSHISCWLKGGEGCPAKEGRNEHHALFGSGPCVAVHPSDLATCLTALDARVKLRGAGGERDLALTDFYKEPEAGRRYETVIEDDELITSVEVPALPSGAKSTYLKAMDRKVWAFALVGVAAVLHIGDNKIQDARLALSGVAPIPWRLDAAENDLKGQVPSEELVSEVARKALEGAEALEHNSYKIPLAERLIKRALIELSGLET